MKTKFLVILNLVIFFNVSAQLINGKIFSSETNNPIPYSRVGLEKNKFGVTSDEYGNFFAASGATTLNLLVKGPDGWGAGAGWPHRSPRRRAIAASRPTSARLPA